MKEMMNKQQEQTLTHRFQIEIGWRTIVRLLLAVLLTYTVVLLWPMLKLLTLAFLIAIILQPIVVGVRRKGGPHWLGLLLATATLVTLMVGCLAIVAPIVLRQMATLGESLPRLTQQIISQLPPSGPIRQALENAMSPGTVTDSRLFLERMLVVAETTLGGLFYSVMVAALAVYLLVEGPGASKWLLLFLPPSQREKVSQAFGEISRLVCAYAAGQGLVSVLCAAYLFLVLTLLGVPMAPLLGIVAGICDILPIIGFFIAVLLAMAMGLTVSPLTAALVFAFYGAYHLFENAYIVPKVYGKKLRISKLAVPLAAAAGGILGGVVGAIAALPLVAAYPVIEKLWLASKLEPDALKAREATLHENNVPS